MGEVRMPVMLCIISHNLPSPKVYVVYMVDLNLK
jgi:hypothetical protein